MTLDGMATASRKKLRRLSTTNMSALAGTGLEPESLISKESETAQHIPIYLFGSAADVRL